MNCKTVLAIVLCALLAISHQGLAKALESNAEVSDERTPRDLLAGGLSGVLGILKFLCPILSGLRGLPIVGPLLDGLVDGLLQCPTSAATGIQLF